MTLIDQRLTIRNWLIGFYIAEFEQKGEDRAKYGDRLVQKLADPQSTIIVFHQSETVSSVLFYHPQIGQSVIAQLRSNFQFNPGDFKPIENQLLEIGQSATDQLANQLMVPPEKLISKLSYTHLVQLFPIADPLKRVFYEIECIKGCWSVAELKRQINSLYFERSGLSKTPEN